MPTTSLCTGCHNFTTASKLTLRSACFAGTRIVLRQVSPESEPIYDFIVALHHHCKGDWKQIQQDAGLSDDELRAFLDYAAQFLGNAGNYKVGFQHIKQGDGK